LLKKFREKLFENKFIVFLKFFLVYYNILYLAMGVYCFPPNLSDLSNNIHKYTSSDIRKILEQSQQIDQVLHVICVISNPCEYVRRYSLAKEFICRMEEEPNIVLYVCELVYQGLNVGFQLTDPSNCRHLQLEAIYPLWHKENMINITVKKLLPPDWKAFAWIDADIEFCSPTWSLDTLKLLNGTFDAVQLFSHAEDLDSSGNPMNIFQGFGYLCGSGKNLGLKGLNYPHPGYGWAYTRELYESFGSIYDLSVLGAGDTNMVFCLLDQPYKSVHPDASDGYKNSICEYWNGSKFKSKSIGWVPGVIKHYYHGSKANRRYVERWGTLISNKYNPNTHVAYSTKGILVPTIDCPTSLLDDILDYFKERDEDN
jgi:hypothetical protein